MSESVRTLTVFLDADYRDEDESVGVIKQAIAMIKGVASVKSGDAVDHAQTIAEMNFRTDIGGIIAEIAVQRDREFINECKVAREKLKLRRGY